MLCSQSPQALRAAPRGEVPERATVASAGRRRLGHRHTGNSAFNTQDRPRRDGTHTHTGLSLTKPGGWGGSADGLGGRAGPRGMGGVPSKRGGGRQA